MPKTVKLTELIVTTETRGAGTEASPSRIITQYWSPEGELLAERDPCLTVIWDEKNQIYQSEKKVKFDSLEVLDAELEKKDPRKTHAPEAR